jgi:hypothetical protein
MKGLLSLADQFLGNITYNFNYAHKTKDIHPINSHSISSAQDFIVHSEPSLNTSLPHTLFPHFNIINLPYIPY